MNPDALSDLVLLLVCAAVLWFHLRQRRIRPTQA